MKYILLGFFVVGSALLMLVWAILGVSGRISQWEEDNLGIRRS